MKILRSMELKFTELVNSYIQQLAGMDDILQPVLCGTKQSPVLRNLEKTMRPEGISCAFSQGAFDYAVDRLSTRLNNIKNNMYGRCMDLFNSSIVLFCMSVNGAAKQEMIDALTPLVSDKKPVYQQWIDELNAMSDSEFSNRMADFQDDYITTALEYKVPQVRRCEVPLTSKLFKIEKSTDTTFPYVISITNPLEARKRITVPINSSAKSLRRLEQYKAAASVTISTHRDTLRVTWAFEKNVSEAPVRRFCIYYQSYSSWTC